MFVTVGVGELSTLGIARVVESLGTQSVIEFFAGPEYNPQPRYKVARTHLRRAMIARETRVFCRTEDKQFWRVGRYLGLEGHLYQIRFPNGQQRFVNEDEIYVRWRKPIENPGAFLAQMVTETPMFADYRARFLACYLAQRAASLGVTSALASAIELQPHQLEVARRVLHDPVQRYLLADEVGLGKTIEAAIVLRQLFIDRPYDASAAVVAPPALTDQWKEELRGRFGLGEYLSDASLQVISTDQINDLPDALSELHLLVVDEAHHITANSHHAKRLYECVRTAARKIPRLLLLSATPVLRNESAFLRMLHLLDPGTYPLDSIEPFKRRIEARQRISEAVAGLVPDNVLVIDQYLDDLEAYFPDDEVLRTESTAVRTTAAHLPDPDDPELIRALSRLTAHLSDTYRLDRRILRNRRQRLPMLTPRRRGAKVWGYTDAYRAELYRVVEDTRRYIDLSGNDADGELRRTLIAAWLEGHDALNQWLDNVPQGLASQYREVFASLRHRIDDAHQSNARSERLYRQLQPLLGGHTKYIVFCSSPRSADEVYRYLRARLPSHVERHARRTTQGEMTWLQVFHSDICKVLVCDVSAEEGLNLQGGAKAVVHYDLPFSPNRIEQRLGRVDRFGSGAAVESFVLICDDDPLECEWYRTIALGFGVFLQSIASLQYLVDEVMAQIGHDVAANGAEALDTYVESLGGPKGQVVSELKKIGSQDALDALSSDEADWEPMLDADADWTNARDAFDGWISKCLLFKRHNFNIPLVRPAGDDVMRYGFVLEGQQTTLLPVTDFATRMAGAVDRESRFFNAGRPETAPYTFRRNTAVSVQGRKDRLRILRAGDPFADGIAEFTANDDRGRAYAFWRYAPAYQPASASNVDTFFRVHVSLQTDTRPAQEAIESLFQDRATDVYALTRRADALLAPMTYTCWLDANLEAVEEDFIQKWLVHPYGKDDNAVDGFDTNIRTDRWNVLNDRGVPELARWSELPILAVERALKRVATDPLVIDRVHAAHGTASEQWRRRAAQFQTRLNSVEGVDHDLEAKAFQAERGVTMALLRGLKDPRFTADSVGALFISNQAFILGEEG